VNGFAADLVAVSSGFIARLDFGELARWGRIEWVSELALTLLVLGVLADDANDTATVNHLALVADRLYRCTDLHGNPRFKLSPSSTGRKRELFLFGSSAKSWRLEG
jgi:hypothetical protein